MCLTIDSTWPRRLLPTAPLPELATRSRTLYKIIDTDNRSEYYSFVYEPDKLYSMNDEVLTPSILGIDGLVCDGKWRVEKGFHAYTSLSATRDQKFWSRIRHDGVGSTRELKVVEFIIPADAHYFLGEQEEIVSDAIISGNLLPIRDD